MGEEGQELLRELADAAALPGGAGAEEPGLSYEVSKSQLLRRWRTEISCAVWRGVSAAIVERGARARTCEAAKADARDALELLGGSSPRSVLSCA